MKSIYIINGINSELAQLFLKKLKQNHVIIGLHRSYKGLKNKNVILIKSEKNIVMIIENKFKGKKKLFF